MSLDRIDVAIIAELMSNGRASHTELSNRVGLSSTALARRQKTLEENGYITTPSGLKYKILRPGNGAEARSGQTVSVHYTGWLKDGGTKFDSSVDRGQPFSFPLGAGRAHSQNHCHQPDRPKLECFQ